MPLPDPPPPPLGRARAPKSPHPSKGPDHRIPSTRFALIALLAWLAVAATAVLVRFTGGAPLAIDAWAHQTVWAAPQTTSASLALQLATLGSAVGAGTLGVLAALVCLILRRWHDGLVIALSMVLGVASSQLLKWVSQRPRPLDLGAAVDGASFPSGHSMGAAVLATSVILAVWAATTPGVVWRPIALTLGSVWIIAMMWSRVALHVHWLSDTVGGLLLGSSVAVLTRYGWQQLRGRRHSRVESKP